MALNDLQRSLLLIFLATIVLFLHNNPFEASDFELKAESGVYARVDNNVSGHVYPYTATAITMTCLLAVIMIIICLGAQLG